MEILIRILIGAIAVFTAAYILPGVQVDSFGTALVVAVVLGALNAFVKPILVILTLPITILTLGLFLLILNALLILLVDNLVTGFAVNGLFWALIFGLVVSVVSSFLHSLRG